MIKQIKQAFTSRSLANHALYRERNNHVVQGQGFTPLIYTLTGICMRMRQYGLRFCSTTSAQLLFCELFTSNTSIWKTYLQAFSGAE